MCLGVLLLVLGQLAPVSFPSEARTVRVDRTELLRFELDRPTEEDLELSARVADPKVLTIVHGPRVLAGERVGWVRVGGRAQGETDLLVEGARLRVRVAPVDEAAAVHQVTPRITAPVSGATVWGRFAIGVETTVGAGLPADRREPAVFLLMPDGSSREPDDVVPAAEGPVQRAVFLVDVDEHGAGPLTLTAAARLADGRVVQSEPVFVQVVAPSERFAGECEAFRWTERPTAFGDEDPRLGRAPDASGQSFVVNRDADPVWIAPLSVESTGLYQVMVVARGDLAVGAFPTVGVCIDDAQDARTAGRLVSRRWHRVPVGRPLALASGEHLLALRFLNDTKVSQTEDRALYLDRFEIARVDVPTAGVAESATGMEAGMQDTMSGAMSDGVSMMSPGASMMAPMMGEAAGGGVGLAVAFENALDGEHVNGRLEIRGWCAWDGSSSGAPAPIVDLLLDGVVVATQQAAKPIFALDRASLAEGANPIALVARAGGARAETPVQTVWVEGRAEPIEGRSLRRFSVLDRRWSADLAPTLSDEREETGHRVAHLVPGAQAELALPRGMTGAHELILEARGPQGGGAVAVAVLVRDAAGERAIGRGEVRGWWSFHALGTVDLDGAESLVVRVAGDADDVGDAAHELVLRSLILRSERERRDVAPRARLLYPPVGHDVGGVDLVVVRAFDEDDRLARADVMLDGRPFLSWDRLPQGVGDLALPLLVRDVTPGPHDLAVRVHDFDGNLCDTQEVRITVTAELDLDGPYARAVHLTDRFAFGPEPRELAAILLGGERAWLEDRLSRRGAGDAAMFGAGAARSGPNRHQVALGALTHLLRTSNPARARFTLWLENHFSTWIGKAYPATSEWREHVELWRLGPAPFLELLTASATSPAMLHYLDQAASFSGRLNENYAREILELHALGVHGGYDQDDVRSLAELLCGLTYAEEAAGDGHGRFLAREFRFAPELGDGRARELFGLEFGETPAYDRFDRFLMSLELIAAHPATARYVVGELCEQYVADPPPEQLVADLAAVFEETGGDLLAVLLALAEHPAFWADPQGRTTTPFDYGLRLGRATEVPAALWAINGYLDRSGMGLFDRATPDGYPEDGAAFADTNATAQRWRLSSEIPWALRTLVPDTLRQAPVGDPTEWRQRVVDAAAVRLTGRLLDERSNRTALDYFTELDGNSWQQVDRVAILVALLPEASLR